MPAFEDHIDAKILAHIRIKKENLLLGYLEAKKKYVTAHFCDANKITTQREHPSKLAAAIHLLSQAATLLKLPTIRIEIQRTSREGERQIPANTNPQSVPNPQNRYLTPRCFFTHNKLPSWLEAEKSFTLDDGTQIIAGKQYRLLATHTTDDTTPHTCHIFLADPFGTTLKLPLETICSNFLLGHIPNTTFRT